MDTVTVKNLNDCIRQLSADLKRCRATDQIFQGYVRLNSSRDGIATALVELQSAADELNRRVRAYQKLIADAAASLNRKEGPNGDSQPL